ncbi:MAG: adenylosuccinate synthase [Candidatus Eremiobacteraeota bacterium]|nr:adenylosuccinate synthase [Candidatus Eremiobacteraeota bacterium]
MSTADIFLGIQWGDEGKGRVVDSYAADYDIVARFGGGDNAGHTLVVGTQKLALRIVPSGVLQERPQLFIGGGTVIGLGGFIAEVDMLAALGVDTSRIKISDRAHVVFPYHAARDAASETARGAAALGTTGRGIGPAYTDKAARVGITFADLRDPASLAARIRANAGDAADAVLAATLPLLPRVLPHVVDGVSYMHEALEAGKRVLIEGAQGTLLDVGYGTYPFVTSSHTIAGGACTGLGIGPTAIRRVVGIAKAYCTRVGAGPFPSELLDATGDALRTAGAEFGTVTGRPRRCGWFDAVAARYAVRLNGLTSAVITKLDVLSGLDKIAIVTGYRVGEGAVGFDAAAQRGLQLEYEWFDGWHDDLSAVRKMADLPRPAARYLAALQRALGVPLDAVSLGPERSSIAFA